eukprot:12576564-Ditylum_brightwellii.AAC.1
MAHSQTRFKTHPGQTLKNNPNDIKLVINKLTEIETYDPINLTVATAIGSSYAFKMYNEISDNDYDIALMLFPPNTHTKYMKQ